MRVDVQGHYCFRALCSKSSHQKVQNIKTEGLSPLDRESSTSGQVNVSFKDAATFGGHDIYSKEDAINHAWAEQNSIDLDDVFSGKKTALCSSVPPSDFVAGLEQNGVKPKVDFLYANLDFNSKSADTLKNSADYIASRYAVMKTYIATNFSGDEQASNFEELDAMLDSAKNRLAQTFSDKVGGFFEEYGVSGEKENIYRSVMAEFDTKVSDYSAFIQSNENYAKLDGTKDEWLKNDSAYMASELRKSVKGADSEKGEKPSRYTLDEMEKMQTFTEEMGSYFFNSHGTSKRIDVFGTEEEIGMQLSEVALKSEMFSKYANVSEKVKNVISKSADSFISRTVDEVQKHIANEIQIKGTEIPSSVLKGLTAINKQAIYDVIGKVKTTYASTGDFYKSFLDGAIYAENQQKQKYQSNKVTGIYRYEQGTYWDNFLKNTDRFSGASDILGVVRTGYTQKESGIESIVNSWNKFANQITTDSNAKLNTTFFSAYA